MCSLSDGLEQNAEDLKSERDKKIVDWGDVEENIRAKRITRSEREREFLHTVLSNKSFGISSAIQKGFHHVTGHSDARADGKMDNPLDDSTQDIPVHDGRQLLAFSGTR